MPTQSDRITGPALLTLFQQMTEQGAPRADVVRAAGYIGTRSDGGERLHFTDFYEAVLHARNLRESGGETRATPAKLAYFADENGEPFGPCLPLISNTPGDGSHGEESLAIVKQWAEDWAEAIMGERVAAAVWIADSEGSGRLLEVERWSWFSQAGTTYSYRVMAADDLPPGVERCAHCGALTTEGESNTLDDETACSGCLDDATSCDQCGEHFTPERMIYTHDGREVCPTCRDEHFLRCPIEGEWFGRDDMVTIYGGGVYPPGSSYRVSQISEIAAQSMFDAGELWHDSDGDFTADRTEDPNYDEDEDDDSEHQGPQTDSSRWGGMCRYGYHSVEANSALGRRIPHIPATYGAEVEYKGEPSDWEAVAEACEGRAILSDDSTVSGELVSAAMGAGEMRRFLSDVAAALAGSRNDEATGLHFHVGRQALTPWQWFRLTHYTKRHRPTLAAIAGRDSARWGSFDSVSGQDWERFVTVWRNCDGDRYDGWSFRRNTVELRCCRSSKTPFRILARFAMLQRLIAIGRLPDSAKPDSFQLQGWLARDENIRRLTGWEVGPWSYHEAQQLPAQADDLSPAHRATRAEVWMAEVRYQAATQVCRNLQDSLPYHWEQQSLGDRITRSLLNEEERRHLQATRDRLILTTL